MFNPQSPAVFDESAAVRSRLEDIRKTHRQALDEADSALREAIAETQQMIEGRKNTR